MICKFPNCEKTLCVLNKERFCFLHTRVLEQNSIGFKQGHFYDLIDKKYRRIGHKTRARIKKYSKGYVFKLKEIVTEEDLDLKINAWDRQVESYQRRQNGIFGYGSRRKS